MDVFFIRYFEQKAQFYKIDKNKIALMGKGYGGFVALHALQKTGLRCAVTVAPITDVANLGNY